MSICMGKDATGCLASGREVKYHSLGKSGFYLNLVVFISGIDMRMQAKNSS